MKKSIFNIEIKLQEEVLIYNTLTFSMIKISMQDWNDIARLDEMDLISLVEMGFLVKDEADEFLKWKKYADMASQKRKQNSNTFVIAPTLNCNANCWYCFERGAEKRVMEESVIAEIINSIKSIDTSKTIKLIWFGGEPMLALPTIEKISKEILKTHKVSAKMITNGSLVEKTVFDKLKELNIFSFQVTLDALYEEYDNCKKYTKGSGYFQKVISNIRDALSYGFNVSVRINVDPTNKTNALEVIKYCIDEFSASPKFNIYAASLDIGDVIPIKEQADVYFECLSAIWDNKSYTKKYNDLKKKYGLSHNIKNCEYVNGVKVFGPIGRYSCHRELGQCNTTTQKPYYIKECESCAVLPICNGGCHINKSRFGEEYGCSLIKYYIQDVIEKYYNEIKKELTNADNST